MKKLIMLLVLVLVFGLSGCGETTQDLKDGFYTQEEVDLMFEELTSLIETYDDYTFDYAVDLELRIIELEKRIEELEIIAQ